MNYNITDADKLKLQSLISANDVENQTPLIRQVKHSELIRTDVQKLIKILKNKNKFKTLKEFESKCVNDCQFIFSNYTDIYNKVLKNELDLNILDNFLNALKDIEDGKDKRLKMQGTQQSKLIQQRQNDSNPVDFENTGENNLGFNIEELMPKV